VLRSRGEATGLFAGNYASAFRGGGLEFDESRPYVPGDDVRSIDWSATARHGETYVKRRREERDQTLLFALDTSASMGFGSHGASKASTAAHAIALLTSAASRAGDRMGLVAFDTGVHTRIEPGRGADHGARIIEAAVGAARRPGGGTDLRVGLRALRLQTKRRSVVFLLSDLRGTTSAEDLAWLARRHDVVAITLVDPLEYELPRVGPIRITDTEVGGVAVLDTSSRRARRRYLAACAARRQELASALVRVGAEPVWLRTDRHPLDALLRFFASRGGRARGWAA
jgi:uncharacterized protein (DUF58 family)